MIHVIGAFFGLVGGVITLDLATIRRIQSDPDGPALATVIVVLACASDAAGNSPLLFVHRMSPRRLFISLGVATLLAIVRLTVWGISIALVISLIEQHLVSLQGVLLTVGIGYSPMLLSALVIIPTLGPFVAKLLHTWTLVTMAASVVAARALPPHAVLGASVLAWLTVLVLSRTTDRLVVSLLGWISMRLLGVDVMRRTRGIDLLRRPVRQAAGASRAAG
jgi:hypothetical protein